MSDYQERTQNGHVFVGSDVNIFAVSVLASGLRLYAKTGMRPNAAYTPTKMLKAAGIYLGKTFKRGEYEKAAQELLEYANLLKSTPRTA
jgi:hypothetical protein